METKIFGDKKIRIRKLTAADIEDASKFADYENSLIHEGAYIHAYKKVTVKDEKEWLSVRFSRQNKKRGVFLIAEYEGRMIGNARVEIYAGSWDHQAEVDIDIAREYRGMGLGSYLLNRLADIARTKLYSKPVRLILGAMAENISAIKFYEESGYKKIAVIPGQYHYHGRFIDEVIMVFYL